MKMGSFTFTRRQALSMVMSVYDPLGLISPALVHGKILFRKLYDPQVSTSWDQDLPMREKLEWAKWFNCLLTSPEVTFPRSTRPPESKGLPRLAGFCDASPLALCVCIYVVWELAGDCYTSRILIGKCRVAPLLGMTVPRGELQSLVILHRLLKVVVEAFPSRLKSISTFSDSLCSLGALVKTSGSMKPYFGNRVAEIHQLRDQIQEYTEDLQPVRHIRGPLNPADAGTRGLVGMDNLGDGSYWQEGPAFLKTRYDSWPVGEMVEPTSSVPSEECKDRSTSIFASQVSSTLPETSVTKLDVQTVEDSKVNPDIARVLFRAIEEETTLGQVLIRLVQVALAREKLEVIICMVARVLRGVIAQDRSKCSVGPNRALVELAVQVILRSSSASALAALEAG